MERRRFIQLFGGLAVGALPGARRALGAPRRVGIVGGGILGSSIAYHLARRGADVVLFEKTKPAAGATANSFAWVNATFAKKPRHYFELNRLGALGYRHLENEIGSDFVVQWGGSLEWYGEEERAAWLREQVSHHQKWGYATEVVDASKIAELEPGVTPGPVIAASWSEHEGSIDPVRTTEVLLDHAKRQGARVEFPCEVTGIQLAEGRPAKVQTSRGGFELDVLVVAAGVDTPRIAALADLDVPLIESPGVLAHTKPADRLLQRVVLSPGAHMKQKPDGRVVAGMGFGRAMTNEGSREEGEAVLASGKEYLPGLAKLELERVTLGYRPLPKDGFPVVGFPEKTPGLYLAVMHSGVTLSPIIGRLASLEILDGADVDLLSRFRLERFAKGTSSNG